MRLEILLSVLNLKNKNLDNMNIKSDCTVVNQCDKNSYEDYKNFKIYSYDEIGLSNSRNRGLEHVKNDIILLSDDDVVYKDCYEELILSEFELNPKADIIVFNIDSPNRTIKLNKKNKKLHFFNILRYTSTRIAFRRKSIEKKNIKFNTLFGAGAKYTHGEDTLFLITALKNHLRIYSSTKNIATVYQSESTWFDGYTEKYFFDKGALFTAINRKLRFVLISQYLVRHKEVLNKISFFKAFRIMVEGSREYIQECKNIVGEMV